jgi:hypothetical protein
LSSAPSRQLTSAAMNEADAQSATTIDHSVFLIDCAAMNGRDE